MLTFTNRKVDDGLTNESAFTLRFMPGSDALGFAKASRSAAPGGKHWMLADVTATASDALALAALQPLFQGAKPVLVFVHGNNTSPAQCFERCTRLQEIYDVEVVGFSWPSEGFSPAGKHRRGVSGDRADQEDRWTLASVTAANVAMPEAQDVIARYKQAKTNGENSIVALARFLRLVGEAQQQAANQQPFSIAAHSLGAYCLEKMVDLRGVRKVLPVARNIALLAACVRNKNHPSWIAKLPRNGQLIITFNISDLVLLGALYADGFQAKLGATTPAPPLLPSGKARYVDFLRQAPLAHEYFVAEQGHTIPAPVRDVFQRIFESKDDIPKGQNPCKVYKGCCDSAVLVCEMV